MKSLIERVKDVRLEPRTSKTGNPYQMLIVEFDTGYSISKPVFGDAEYILNSILDS